MSGSAFENAAQRRSYVGKIHQAGSVAAKERILAALPHEFADLHRDGSIHIHDLDAYGETYNCLQADVLRGQPWTRLAGRTPFGKITGILDHYRDLVVKLGNEQSGGIGFPNFDLEVEILFERLGLALLSR